MPDTSDRKFQDGDYVIHNELGVSVSERDSNARVIKIYTPAGKSRGDWAYTIEYIGGYNAKKNGGKPWKTQVWGHTLRHAMFKYDPKQAGDTEEDI